MRVCDVHTLAGVCVYAYAYACLCVSAVHGWVYARVRERGKNMCFLNACAYAVCLLRQCNGMYSHVAIVYLHVAILLRE